MEVDRVTHSFSSVCVCVCVCVCVARTSAPVCVGSNIPAWRLLSIRVRAFCVCARVVFVLYFYFCFVVLFLIYNYFYFLLFVFVRPMCVRCAYERTCLRGSIPAYSLPVYVRSVCLRMWCWCHCFFFIFVLCALCACVESTGAPVCV